MNSGRDFTLDPTSWHESLQDAFLLLPGAPWALVSSPLLAPAQRAPAAADRSVTAEISTAEG